MADAEDKTSAINLADFGLAEEHESTVSVESAALKAQAAKPQPAARPAPQPARPAPAPAASDDSEKTTAFRVEDLPPDDEPSKRGPQKTLLGHPAPKPGAAVRGGAAPAKRQETLAIAPGAVKQAMAASYTEDNDKTSALSLDDIEKIDAAPPAAKPQPAPARPSPAPQPAAKPAPAPARAVPAPKPAPEPEQFEKTTALSLDDIDMIDHAPLPKKPAAVAAKAPAHIEESEKTMAVPLDDAIAAIDAAPPRRAEAAKRAAAAAVEQSFDEEEMQPVRPAAKAAKPAAKPAGKAAGGKPAAARGMANADAMMAPDGFMGKIGYFLTADGKVAKGELAEVDSDMKSAGMRNLIIVGGAIAVLTLVFGIIW